MTETSELRNLMASMATELGDLSRVSRRLEAVCGGLATRAKPTNAEVEALQELDRLSQHLVELAHLCQALGVSAESSPSVRDAVDRVRLSDLQARLSKTPVINQPAGEAELW